MLVKRSIFYFFLVCAWLSITGAGFFSPALATPPADTPSPTYDPLTIPELPDNPSAFEMGEYLYYFHCMPCHGDLGQGLTDAFRAVWVEDHQNCWGRGCHSGRSMDEGFPIPTVVPQIIATDDALPQFADFDELQTYLHDTHPPQYPGKLEDSQYQALTVFLWAKNDKPTLTLTPVTEKATQTPPPTPLHVSFPSPAASHTPQPALAQVSGPPPTSSAPVVEERFTSAALPTSLALITIVVILLGYFLFRSGSNRGSDR
jgi:hypothetical protein